VTFATLVERASESSRFAELGRRIHESSEGEGRFSRSRPMKKAAECGTLILRFTLYGSGRIHWFGRPREQRNATRQISAVARPCLAAKWRLPASAAEWKSWTEPRRNERADVEDVAEGNTRRAETIKRVAARDLCYEHLRARDRSLPQRTIVRSRRGG